ncbi:alpha/beta hydrolase [Aquisalimonas sp. 2447]|uniref:alpha/beta fold hydrolase n=1 Tax=Aquisalimonas sp. 2447 TaxID=2740807 RepID=UPI00143242D9|nr:alpha/beta hydrolase [Aquisalimonas sp. 2447]QIT56772.1 alpha/beta hydrolase [Aquisalimonas sp. 2447]
MKQERLTSLDGLSLPVQRTGSGPPLIIVPGWLATPADWQPVIQRLADQHTCYIWEARPWHHDHPTIAAMADDLRALVAALAPQGPSVLGHSMGALTCWEYVRRHGCSDLTTLCLVDQTPRMVTGEDWALGLEGGFPPESNRALIDWMWQDFPAAAMDVISRGRRVAPGSGAARLEAMFRETRRRRLEALEPAPWIRAWESFSWQDYRDVLPQVQVPTLLIYGAASFYGMEVARYVHRRTPDSRLRIHAVAGHSPHQDDLPGVVEDIRRFTAARQPCTP